MLRRPPRDGGPGAHQRTSLFALAILFLASIPLADAQQQQQAQHASQPPIVFVDRGLDSDDNPSSDFGDRDIHQADPVGGLGREWTLDISDEGQANSNDRSRRAAVASPQQEEAAANNAAHHNEKRGSSRPLKEHYQQREKKSTPPFNTQYVNDARAVATLAPAQSVRAPPSRHRPGSLDRGSGISTPPRARSLEEWEVEDFVLLATVDGDLYANDRKTGAQRWHLEVDQPMVETQHHRIHTSDLDDDHNPVDHYVWAVEPSRDGSLYIWMPGASDPALVPTGLTMKKLVEELSPLANDQPPVIYTGTKRTTMITLDAATGRVLKWFGSSGSHVNEAESCLRPTALYGRDSEECSSTGTITLGRTEYEVAINRKDGHSIATLKYSEWTPNIYDKDLISVHQQSLDNRYHSSRHDGRLYAFDPDDHPMFTHKFSAPVARVFDVCRPWGVTRDKNPDLLVLPQPVPAPKDEDTARTRSSHVFLNQTVGGSWYALSGVSYPLIVDAPPALTSRPEWWQLDRPWHRLNEAQKTDAMIGRHNFEIVRERGQSYPPTLPGGPISKLPDDLENDSSLPSLLPEDALNSLDGQAIITKVKSIPQQAANSILDLLSNPVLIILMVGLFFFYHKDLIRWSRNKSQKWLLQQEQHSEAGDIETERQHPEHSIDDKAQPHAQPDSSPVTSDQAKAEEAGSTRSEEPTPPATEKTAPSVASEAEIERNPADLSEKDDPSHTETGSVVSPEQPTKSDPENGASAEKKKPKAHRGRRGGVKHRKGGAKKRDFSQSRDDEPPVTTVDDAVKNAQKLGNPPRLEPDVMTVTNDMQSVTGPVIKLGNIEVDTENQLGTGSNGTLVFAGRFDGREVAVKRMLIQFYDIASQETRLLRESDDHPNVIRYYAQEFRDGFLYIALERCAASLAEVVEKPNRFPKLAQAGTADLPNVLYQITNGIHHLHSLRIVHRDLKPQNILVNMGKDGTPRLLVSDFGLCKKLEGGQSSFGATTGRAAGTSGWRAPELLVDDDKDLGDSSVNSGSGTVLVNSEMMPGRRATRSIDIFSLGLVFFYVLTNGLHPFDCGDRYMREVNIRKGKYNLAPLEVLGDFAFEAKDLVGSMLSGDSKQRPNTRDIMAHPFFWPAKKRLAFLCDVSDHFEKEPRDPPSAHLQELESQASVVIPGGDFLRQLPREFVESLGKQRKYSGSKLLDLLRALRNKRNHYEDIPDALKRVVGPLPDGYLAFWTVRFPELLVACWNVIWIVRWDSTDRFREYYEPAAL